VKPTPINLIIMADLSPAYTPAPEETKGMYPSTPSEQQQQPAGPPGYEAITYYSPAGAQQQQLQQLVIAPGAKVIVEKAQPPDDLKFHWLFSCFAFLCGAWPFGLVAFILAST